MGDDNRPRSDLKRGFGGLHVGMCKVDEHAEPIALLNDGCPE